MNNFAASFTVSWLTPIPVISFALASPAKFGERGFNLLVAGEAAFRRRTQAAIDAGKLFRRGLVFAVLQSGVEFKRELGKLVLDMRRPCLDAFQNLGQLLCLHERKCTTIASGGEPKNGFRFATPILCARDITQIAARREIAKRIEGHGLASRR